MQKQNRNFFSLALAMASLWLLLLIATTAIHHADKYKAVKRIDWSGYSPFNYTWAMLVIGTFVGVLVALILSEKEDHWPRLPKKDK